MLTRNRIFVDRTRDVGVITKDRAIVYALSGQICAARIEHDLRRKHPYLDYEKYHFDVVIGTPAIAIILPVRIEEMRQSVRILRQVIEKLPDGPINVVDWKNTLPPKSHVMTKMEELIHHFIVVTEVSTRRRGKFISRQKIRKVNLVFTLKQRRRRAVSLEDSRTLVR